MKIKYLAHSAFLITTGSGVKIITDPYAVAGPFKYQPISETADVVTVSHEHGDHNYVKAVKGNPTVLRDSGEAKGIKFKAVMAAHDENGGSQRGNNVVFCFKADGITICHCGDLGHVLTPDQVKALGKVDVLLLPVGGFFTIDAAAATKVWQQLKPAVTIPMHYKTEKADMPISGVEDFLKGKTGVVRCGDSEIELTKEKMPAEPQIMVLKPALF
jgi:L-ascorbate metabolism protein UlaG (beta-lactamase superfamily)